MSKHPKLCWFKILWKYFLNQLMLNENKCISILIRLMLCGSLNLFFIEKIPHFCDRYIFFFTLWVYDRSN